MKRVYFSAFENEQSEGSKYSGVLVIKEGPALGHFVVKNENGSLAQYDASNPDHVALDKYQVTITRETLADIVESAEKIGAIKAKLDHGETVRDIVGTYTRFRIDGDKVRADLELLESSPHKSFTEELFAKVSGSVGNSIDFKPKYELSNGRAVVRCVRLNSVDIVDTPAATTSLFNQPNQEPPDMLSTEDLQKLAELVKTEVASQFSAFSEKLNARFEEIESDKKEEEKKEDEKLEEETKEEKKEEEKKEEMECGPEKMAAMIEKATLSAVQKLLPKAQIAQLGAAPNANKDQYQEKFDLALAAGLTESQAILHVARKFPALHNAKFGSAEQSAKI